MIKSNGISPSAVNALGRARNASLHHRPHWSRVDNGVPHPDRAAFGLTVAEEAVETLILWLELVASADAARGGEAQLEKRTRGIYDTASNAAHHLRERTKPAAGLAEDGD